VLLAAIFCADLVTNSQMNNRTEYFKNINAVFSQISAVSYGREPCMTEVSPRRTGEEKEQVPGLAQGDVKKGFLSLVMTDR
jgi:hypothetical protein